MSGFDVCGPLPTGVTVLEASAGTGKTYTIAALAARYVADGKPLDRLLLVTFTRMATGELRERVRERLVSAERVLAGAALPRDEVERLLLATDVEPRRANLAKALADFDAATIATTHGFCQEVLGGLGVAGDAAREAELVEDVSDLVGEVVDDLYVRRFHREGEPPPFSRGEAARIATIAVANPDAPIAAAAGGTPAMRARLADAVRNELALRKQRAGVMTYDDLLTRLDKILDGPGANEVIRRLRARFEVVLVDEFQDTDPVQWNIVRRAFGDAGALVLIGDPKQAIYAFRGADVFAYLEAAQEAGTRATLGTNRRSDQSLIDAYDALFGGARLGHDAIVYRQVKATPEHQAPRLAGAGAALRIRQVHRDEPDIVTTQHGYARNQSARDHIATDLAADLVRLLSSDARIEGRRVEPGDVAVLVGRNRSAAQVRDALEAVDVPAVINGAGSVFGTASAGEWLRLLEALERPASSPRARAAALTPFLGWTAERVATAAEPEWEAVHRRLHDWARVLRLRGVASLGEAIALAEGLPERVLATVEGERHLTDLRHVAQLLHQAATAEGLGTTALAAWLRRRIAEAGQDTSDEDRSRRLESDADAVQVLTIHRSKGLEFPIVYLPFPWEPSFIPKGEPVAFHDPQNGDRRTIDVALEGQEFDAHKALAMAEQRGEDLRLAYVALTRARHQAVVWWAPSFDSRHSALGRLLFARAEDGSVPPVGRGTPTDVAAAKRFAALAEEAPGCISVERSTLAMPVSWSGAPGAPARLAAADFDRTLDAGWRRTSFTDITRAAHEARVASEPEEPSLTDEPASAPRSGEAPDAVAVPLDAMPAGADVGTFVHRLFERTDFAAADLDGELAAHARDLLARSPVDVGDPAAALRGLRIAIETPLDESGRRLRDVTHADRLDELAFELPLAGGDAAAGRLDLDAVAAVLRAHLPADDPLGGYADRLGDPALRRSVGGYATGSLDLVLRSGERFAVVDYKTNRLAAAGETLTAWHHRPAALRAEMERAHYGLQALLYTVALHRYLRWRLPGYAPERNLAGALYLFLRGMTGTPGGVFAWSPPAPLVIALSEALDGGAA